jgi:stage V sporulation protein D (sporulation-specific penicillin-binding protein)
VSTKKNIAVYKVKLYNKGNGFLEAWMQSQRNRLFFLFIVSSLLMLALVGRLVYIHVFWSDDLTQRAKQQQNKSIVVPAKRGDIVDRNGDILAFSIKTYSVWANVESISKKQETADIIANALGLDGTELLNKMTGATTDLVRIVSDMTKSEADLIRGENLWGISITEDTKRLYPYGNLAAHLIGNVNADNQGFLGVELSYDMELAGDSGLYYVTTDVHGRQLAYGEDDLTAPTDGDSVQLTLDTAIEYFVEQRLSEALETYSAKRASAIVMDPNTGEILAMASKPDFDLNDPRTYQSDMDEATWATMTSEEKLDYWNQMWRNPVLSDTYEPGSIFKSITAATALEEGLFNLNSEFFCEGYKIVSGVKLHCWYYPRSHGEETFLEAFINSCNPAFIEIISAIGVDRMYDYLDKFGFMEKTGINLPAESGSITQAKENIGPVELATLSYGHGINVTMLQLVRAVSALVNGGNLMEPMIVKAVYDADGNLKTQYDPTVTRRVISESTSEKMRTLFQSTVELGGGKRAAIDGISIGGKTGTSVKLVDGVYDDNVVLSSFVGIAPMEDPQFVVLVAIDEPQNGDEIGGSYVAAPIVKEIFEDILRYRNIVPEDSGKVEVTIPDLSGLTVEEAAKALEGMSLQYTTEPLEIDDTTRVVIDQFPKAGTVVEKNSTVILSIEP